MTHLLHNDKSWMSLDQHGEVLMHLLFFHARGYDKQFFSLQKLSFMIPPPCALYLYYLVSLAYAGSNSQCEIGFL